MKLLSRSCLAVTALILGSMLASCGPDDAKVASQQISKAADNFEVNRRVVFINGITDRPMLSVEGRCSIKHDSGQFAAHDQLEVTCKLGPERFVKHYLGLSHNVTYFAEQSKTISVSTYHYRVTFKPQAILPDIDFRFSGRDLATDQSEENKRQLSSQ